MPALLIAITLFPLITLADFSNPVTVHRQMVVSAHAIASRIGNDIDAAVAMAYTLAMVHPCCGNLGGGGFMTVHLAENKRDLSINFREKAPLAASRDMYLDADGRVDHQRVLNSYLSVGVPGTVFGLETARERYGSLPRRTLITPATSRDSFTLTRSDTDILVHGTRRFQRQPNVAAVFLRDGEPLKPGDRLVQRELATTLERIAAKGADGFYRGPTADALIAASQANGGILSHAGLEGYTVAELEPIRCDYRGYQLVSMPPPSSVAPLLEGFSSYIQTDGYQGCNAIAARPDITQLGCWVMSGRAAAHVTRQGFVLFRKLYTND